MMLKQNDPRLNGKIQGYGCNFMSHLMMVREDWLPEEVELLYQKALNAGFINENCRVMKPNELLGLAGTSYRQIGGLVLATNERWGELESSPRVRFKMARWAQRKSRFEHFTLCNAKGEYYDPYDALQASYGLEKERLLGYQFYG